MKTGCRKTIVRYRGKESYCPYCGSKFVPPQVKEVRRYRHGKGFHAWVAYLRVAFRLSCRLVEKFTRDLFHEEISLRTIEAFFKQTADSHEVTEELLLRRILQSPAIHVDETKISIRGVHQQVWGITNGRDVVFRLTETRETGFLQELLNGYQGVLVSDFYGGYDAITCRQQKCLVHLIRDLNDDLWKNPFNAEYEQFVAAVRDLLVPIVEDIERYGLKALHLRKHRKRVDCFTGTPWMSFQDSKKSFRNIRSVLSDIEIRCSSFWVRMESLGITMPLSVHFVILLSSVRFRGISLKKGQAGICVFLPLRKHAASKISHS